MIISVHIMFTVIFFRVNLQKKINPFKTFRKRMAQRGFCGCEKSNRKSQITRQCNKLN